MPLHFKLRSVDLEVKYASWGRGLNGVLTLYYVLLFFRFCKTLFLTKQSLKGFHYNVELLLAGKGKADTFLFKGIYSYASTKFFGLSNSSAHQV